MLNIFRVPLLIAAVSLTLFKCGSPKKTSSNPNAGSGGGNPSKIGLIGQIDVSDFIGLAFKQGKQGQGQTSGYYGEISAIKKDGSDEGVLIPNLPSGDISDACEIGGFVFLEQSALFGQPEVYAILKRNGRVYGIDQSLLKFGVCRTISGVRGAFNLMSNDNIRFVRRSGENLIVTLDASSGELVITSESITTSVFYSASNSSGDIIYSSNGVGRGDGRFEYTISIRDTKGKIRVIETVDDVGGGQPRCFFAGAGETKDYFYYVKSDKFNIVKKSGETFTKITSSISAGTNCPESIYPIGNSLYFTNGSLSTYSAIFGKITTRADGDLTVESSEIPNIQTIRKMIGKDNEIFLVVGTQGSDGVLKLNTATGIIENIQAPDSATKQTINDFSVLPGKWLSFLQYNGGKYAHKFLPEAIQTMMDGDITLPQIAKLILWEVPGCKEGYGRKSYVCTPFVCESKKVDSVSCVSEKLNSAVAAKSRTCSEDRFSFSYGTCVAQQCNVGHSLLAGSNECAPNICQPNTALGNVSCVDDKPNSSVASKSKSCSTDGQTFIFGSCSVSACANGFVLSANNCNTNVTIRKSKFTLYTTTTINSVSTDNPVVGSLTVTAGSTTKIQIGRDIEFLYNGGTIGDGYTEPSTNLQNTTGSHTDYTWSVTGGSLNRIGILDGYSYNYVAPTTAGTYKLNFTLVKTWQSNSGQEITNAVKAAAGSQFTREYSIIVQ
jgi:hypothetical protein